MSAVLAVLDGLIQGNPVDKPELIERNRAIDEARAAVADLIEREAEQRAALDRVDKVLREFEGMTGAGYQYMAANVRSAIAGKGGVP